MRLVLAGIVALIVACSPNRSQAQLGPGDANEPAPGPLGGTSRIVPLDGEEAQESALPDPNLPSLPDTPPPDVDTSPLQEPLTLGPFETGQTQENQSTPGQPQETELPQPQNQVSPQQTQPTQIPQPPQFQQAPSPGAATQFADPNTQAILQRLQDQELLLEERQLLLDEREALLQEREAYLDERTQYLQERELTLREQAEAAAVQEDQITVGEFFTGDAARYAEQFDEGPDRFQPGVDGNGFAPGLDGGDFNPGPPDTRSPFFTTNDPPESP